MGVCTKELFKSSVLYMLDASTSTEGMETFEDSFLNVHPKLMRWLLTF